jgi:hypothetical protein
VSALQDRGGWYYSGTRTRRNEADWAGAVELKSQVARGGGPSERFRHTYDIFEGTEQIQQLVIARAISGLRTE